jgi:hypothetical protein
METKASKKRNRRWTWLRYRKGDHAHNLMVAAQHWIHANRGTAVVLGGIEIIQFPGEAYKYRVAISAVGATPQKPEKSA